MSGDTNGGLTRRDLLKNTGKMAAATALASVALPHALYAGGSDAIQLALVGCGGRGTGAAGDAMSSKAGPTRLVAMADVFQNRLEGSLAQIKPQFEAQIDVPEDRKFIGFDAYKNAMDSLKPGDVVILTTPPAFRWVHFTYAISRGLNVFMEKPITVDGPSTRRMLKLGEDAKKKNLKVGVGLMCRHCKVRQELFDRIQNGEIGDLITLRAYRMHPPVGHAFVKAKPADLTELLYQVREFHAFLWASGGLFSDFLIHNIDECCWMKNAWPVEAKGVGGRHYRGDFVDQNFDNYSVEYTFDDGTKMFLEGRYMEGCDQEFASYAHGSKGSAWISRSGHTPAHCRIFKGQKFSNREIAWRYPSDDEPNPYRLEWDDLINAIRNDTPYNEVKRGAEASLVTAMGRMACHIGKTVTFDDMLNCAHELAPTVDKLAFDSPAPVRADSDGRYPVPQPGLITKTEYQV